VPAAVDLLEDAPAPRLVSIAGGGNDLLRPGGDPDTLAELFDDAVARLRESSDRVLVFTGFDPRAFWLMSLLRGKIAAYNMHLRAIADNRGCDLVDLWSMRFLTRPAAWSSDRLHLTSESHRAIAERAAEVLGMSPAAMAAAPPPIVWSKPATAARRDRAAWMAARREDYRWAREHLAPWLGRRLRGTSSGDDRLPKRPELLPPDQVLSAARGGAGPVQQGAGHAEGAARAQRQLGDAAVRDVRVRHGLAGADRREASPDKATVPDHEDPAARRVRKRVPQPARQPRGHLVVVLPPGEGPVLLPGLPRVRDLQVDRPRLLIPPPVEGPDVQFAQLLHHHDILNPNAPANHLRGFHRPAQRGTVDPGGRISRREARRQLPRLGAAALGERVIHGHVRQLPGQVRLVLAVPDVPDFNAVPGAALMCHGRQP
jgi:hypothetical protein